MMNFVRIILLYSRDSIKDLKVYINMVLNLIGKLKQNRNFNHSYFCRYIEDLTNGTYLQQTVESVIANEAGKQLMVKPSIKHSARQNLMFIFFRPKLYIFSVSC
jgi:hypothetical protein